MKIVTLILSEGLYRIDGFIMDIPKIFIMDPIHIQGNKLDTS